MTSLQAPLRIAQVVEALESGGAEKLAIEIAGAFADRGHDSHLIVLRAGGAFENRLPSVVHFHDLGRPRRDGAQLARLAYFAGTVGRLGWLIRSLRIELIQCHLPKANYLGLAMAAGRICSVCPTVHNNREFDYGDHASALKKQLRRASYRQMIRTCPAVIAVSDRVRTSLVDELGAGASEADRIMVVPNGVAARAPVDPASRSAARAEWGVAEGEVLLVAVGRLTLQKDHAVLVDALQGLRDSAPNWRCLIAGEGELEADLARQISEAGLAERVRLVGLVGDVGRLLNAADVFCLPSRYEGLPLSLLEAMAAGLPTVAFAIDGVQEVIEDGKHGLLAPARSAVAFREALGRLVRDGRLRDEMGCAARELATDWYGFRVSVDRLEAIYRAVLTERVGRR